LQEVRIVSIRRNRGIGLGAVVMAGAVAMGAYAFTNSTTVPATTLGYGSTAVGAYVATNVVYTYAAGDPSEVESVTFHLDSAAADVQVQVESGGAWLPCDETDPDDPVCTLNVNTADIDQLAVAAKDRV
jgi:hypothetical protein